ncbi:alpha/beta fold hydrolase [Streptomyces sp. NBC_00016]|uniref:alpha/beta fold hydrolase n=1 Tax=Streptomyces sp. NBC_00016 TaxID=2975622 RepID=UPI003867109A
MVLLLHGWPESRYSWRHQFGAPAAAGYRVAAPDQRGYAGSHPLSRHGRRRTTFRRTCRTSSCTASGRSPVPSTGAGTSNATTNCSHPSGVSGSPVLRCMWWETATWSPRCVPRAGAARRARFSVARAGRTTH